MPNIEECAGCGRVLVRGHHAEYYAKTGEPADLCELCFKLPPFADDDVPVVQALAIVYDELRALRRELRRKL